MSGWELAIFENRPRLTPELQRQFQTDADVKIRDFRSISELNTTVVSSTSTKAIQATANQRTTARTVVLLDLEADPAGCLRFLEQHLENRPQIATVVVGSEETSELEWPIRELGAVTFINDYHAGLNLAQLCRQLSRKQTT